MLQDLFCATRGSGRGGGSLRTLPWTALVFAGLAAPVGCARAPLPVDLVRGADSLLQEASVGGRDRAWTVAQAGKPVRINDVVRATLPASPPSRMRFKLAVPGGGRLSLACGIPNEFAGRPGIEFSVKVSRSGHELTLWHERIDPASNASHRGWVVADFSLAEHAGRETELILETQGFEDTAGDPRRAFWGSPAVTVPADEPPLAIVYLVDTLRADHTSPYGYARDTTPELTAFARDAVLFEAAIAHASWTKPSVASLFTSQLPGRHRAVQLRDPLDPGLVTLAEMLQGKGFTTGAAIANSVIYSEGGNFDQGFDVFAGLHGAGNKPSKLVPAAGVVDAALGWLDSRRGFPRFLYVHTMDPHVPYAPPAPFDRKYDPPPAPGHPGVDPRTDFKEPLDRQRMIAQYDGDIAYGDQEFGRFVRELKSRGLYERALIVFLADHGEEFQDHDGWLHGRSVFDELIRVPLVVKFPGNRDAGRRVAQQVQEVDVLPTLLEALSLPVPEPPAIAGRPLQAVLRGGAPEPPAVAEISHRGFVAHGMRTARDKYVQRFSPQEDELYFDLVRDPRESVNRIGEGGGRAQLLRRGVEAAMVANPFRHTLRIGGQGEFALTLKTRGWIEGVEAQSLGGRERTTLEANGRRLALVLRPTPDRSREISFGVRPRGAPVWLEGTRDGRPLRKGDVLVAQQGLVPDSFPYRIPDLEPPSEGDDETTANLFAPPPDGPGVHVWLTLVPGRTVLEMDAEMRERLKALGYVGN
jgi:arylsulfatase A-like enzyme